MCLKIRELLGSLTELLLKLSTLKPQLALLGFNRLNIELSKQLAGLHPLIGRDEDPLKSTTTEGLHRGILTPRTHTARCPDRFIKGPDAGQ